MGPMRHRTTRPPMPPSSSLSPIESSTQRVQSSYPVRLPPDASQEARRVFQGRQLRLHELLLEVLCDAVVVTDHQGIITHVNPAAEQMFERRRCDMEGTSIFQYLGGGKQEEEVIRESIETRQRFRDRYVGIMRSDGTIVSTMLAVSPMCIGQDRLVRIVGVFRDVTELETAHAELARVNRQLEALITVDEKTGLLNERGFRAELTRISREARRFQEPLALLYMDLVAFKRVNDAYGHDAGDVALQTFAGALRSALYPTDTIGRLHGDEFVAFFRVRLERECGLPSKAPA